MSKLVYFLVPIGILFGGITVTQFNRAEALIDETEEMKHLSHQLTVIDAEPPMGLNFCGERVPLENAKVKKRMDREIRKNIKYHAATLHTFKRMYRYQDQFLKILRRKGVPEDFFYMSVAESNLSNATSPVGAQGFWQFMRPTALHYGLEVSATVDERFHPEKATEAACAYLLDAQKQLGSWTLVAAAYNMGSGGVRKAISKQQTEDYYALKLNRETGQYMYRILGYKCIMEEPFRYGFSLNERQMYRPIPYYTVKVSEDIDDLVAFARDNNATYRELKTLNPWLIADKLTVKEGKTYEIRFPLVAGWTADEMLVEDPDKLDAIDAEMEVVPLEEVAAAEEMANVELENAEAP
jgi:membrane-bound lytic murein transglycosylase D